MRALADQDDPPAAEVVRVVLDNLSTHTVGALYETFVPDEARGGLWGPNSSFTTSPSTPVG